MSLAVKSLRLNKPQFYQKNFVRFNAAYSARRKDREAGGADMGLPIRFYVPPSLSRYPNIFTSPMVCLKLIARRMYNFGYITSQIGLVRYKGLKPEFLLWKNEAVDVFVNVNKAFAKRKIEAVEGQLSMWSKEPLLKRQETLSKNFEYDWKLLKLNSTPKLKMFLPHSSDSEIPNLLLAVYEIDSKQRLSKLNKKTREVTKNDVDIVNYLGYSVDTTTNKLRLIGSTFESGINDEIKMTPDNMGTNMRIQGDIYRANDDVLKALTEKSSK